MTELTDEAVTALLAHYDLPTDCDCDGDDCVKCSHYPTFQERASKQLKDAAPDLARALLDARAELAATQTQVGDWIVRADEANVKVEKLEAELARNKTLATENARIRAAQPDWLQNCVVCKRVVDTREQADGGDPHGSGDADGGWVCSIECAEVQHPSPPPADGWTWHERLGWIGPDGKPADPRRRG